MRRILVLLLLLAAPLLASEFKYAVRALKSDDRAERRLALEDFAKGRLRPESRAETDLLERNLLRILSDRFPGSERAQAVDGLGRLGRARAYEQMIEWVEKERDDRVLLAMERAFRRGPEKLADTVLQRMGRTRDPLERAILVRLLGALPGEKARKRVRHNARIADHWAVRATAVYAVGQHRDPEVFPNLIELLDSNEPALVVAAVESLSRLTGRRYGDDIAEWKAWWRTEGHKDPLKRIEKPAEPDTKPDARPYSHEREPDRIRPYFFGIPVTTRRVAFVFDVSASMRYKLPLAYDQLVRAIKGLPSNALFDVVFFNEHVWPWRDRLCHADPVTKELLVRHLPTIEIKSYTNLFDSIERALRAGPSGDLRDLGRRAEPRPRAASARDPQGAGAPQRQRRHHPHDLRRTRRRRRRTHRPAPRHRQRPQRQTRHPNDEMSDGATYHVRRLMLVSSVEAGTWARRLRHDCRAARGGGLLASTGNLTA